MERFITTGKEKKMPRSHKSISLGIVAFLAVIALMSRLEAMDKTLFQIDDFFRVLSLTLADLTRDGEWLACTLSTPEDRLPQDNFRYGDPTYIAPSRADVVVLNSRTGKQTRISTRNSRCVRSNGLRTAPCWPCSSWRRKIPTDRLAPRYGQARAGGPIQRRIDRCEFGLGMVSGWKQVVSQFPGHRLGKNER